MPAGAYNPAAVTNSVVNLSGGSGTGSGGCLGSDSGSNSNLTYPQSFVNFLSTPAPNQPNTPTPIPASLATPRSTKSVQTEITTNQMLDSASAIETKNTRIDELQKEKDDIHKELLSLKRDHEKQGFSFKKCLSVNKKLLIEKSTLEKKQARQKCMENRLRLGQFVTQRQGATFVENWVDGSAFNDIMKQQEIMNHAKEELDKERKLLQKKRPQLEKESGAKQTKETKLLVKQGGVQNLPSPSSPSPTGSMMQAGGGGSAGGAGGSANNQVVTTSTSSSVAAAIAANSAAANNSTAGAAGQSKADDADIFVKPYSQS